MTSAVASPLCGRHELAKRPDHVAHREQAAVRGHELEEFRRKAADAGPLEHRGERLQLLVGGKHRAAHQPRQIGAFGDQRIEPFEIGLDGVDRVRLAREIEQRGRVAARHAGNDGFFACHFACSFGVLLELFRKTAQPARTVGASPWDLSGTWSFAGAAEMPREPAKIAALLT